MADLVRRKEQETEAVVKQAILNLDQTKENL